jgi:uncharacterized Zn-binding protein involved in type VI secretion
VRDGDTTSAHGRVGARPRTGPATHHGRHAAFEGDPVWCPACKTHGVTRCVAPMRPHTGPDGRQACLDGDLCVCGCPVPPRLIASHQDVRMGFGVDEMTRIPGIDGWLAHAGHSTVAGFDEHFVLHDAAHGKPVDVGFAYGIASHFGEHHGAVGGGDDGVTAKVHADAAVPVGLLYAVQTEIGVEK